MTEIEIGNEMENFFKEKRAMYDVEHDPNLYQVRNNPRHARFPSDPDTRRRLERVIGQPVIDSVNDSRPTILYPLVLLCVIVLCVIGMVYMIVIGV